MRYPKKALPIVNFVCYTNRDLDTALTLSKFVAYITKRGVPIWSLICTSLICLVTFATSFIPGKALFLVLTALSGVAGFVTWGGICFAHYRFRKAMIYQGRSIKELPIAAPFHPFGDIFGMLACTVIALISGYSYFVPADAVGLIGNYAGLIVCAILFIVLKFYTGSKMVPISEIDLDTGRADASLYVDNDGDSEITGPWYVKAWKHFIIVMT